MAGRSKDSVRHFVRLAGRRLSYAEFLLDALRSGQDTPEGLANLAVDEAAMADQASDRSVTEASFRGANPHRFEWLRARLRMRGVALPRRVIQSLARLSWWDYDRRYDLKVILTERASEFLAEADIVVTWVRERI